MATLEDGGTNRLIAFGERHRDTLRDPYEEQPLAEDWADRLEVGDVQEVADFVLTRYYDPAEDGGLGEAWLEIEGLLGDEGRMALLGHPFGPEEKPFDPGRMGAYFQDADEARRSLEVLRPLNRPELATFISTLERAVGSDMGLYVTF